MANKRRKRSSAQAAKEDNETATRDHVTPQDGGSSTGKRKRRRRRRGGGSSSGDGQTSWEDGADYDGDAAAAAVAHDSVYGHSRALPVMHLSAEDDALWEDMMAREWSTHPPDTPEEYLLRVRLEALHKMQSVAVAKDVDTRILDVGRTRKLVDQFREHRSQQALVSDAEKILCLKRFNAVKSTLQKECDNYRKNPSNERYALDESVNRAMPLNSDDDGKWKAFCLGSDGSMALDNETASPSGGQPLQYENEEEIEITLLDEAEDSSSATQSEGEHAQDRNVVSMLVQSSNDGDSCAHEPSLPVLLKLDHITTHKLFHRIAGWITNANAVYRPCFVWLHSMFLLLDAPLPAKAAADMNDLYSWCLRRRRKLIMSSEQVEGEKRKQEEDQLNAMMTIIVGHFKQGDESLL